ncbi:flavodoxin family protein [Catenulispora subtropica]|uniref:Flavodoxin family protein n=1 Tax=Catenulispora subtropica TaxID=450798 RepID=A0ABN2SH96_9ACTN
MKALIVYESMYGNTRAVAEAVASGLSSAYETEVKPVAEATGADVGQADLLVVGGPTHVHGLSRPSTRKAAADAAASDEDLSLEPAAQGVGLREWFDHLDRGDGKRAAAFDTRLSAPPLFTGRGSLRIAKHLRKSAFEVADDPVSFLVDKKNHLLDGELERAQEWGKSLAG